MLSLIQKIGIIPEPVSLTLSKGYFNLSDNIIIYYDKELLKICDYLKKLFFPSTGFNFIAIELEEMMLKENTINLVLHESKNNRIKEGYSLEITPQNINILAEKPVGIFYAIQTLRQILPAELESKNKIEDIDWKVPCLKIEDFPRFSWRGYMLDEARHFHGKDVVKKLLELMALLKLNIFHWHLSDDQGWRIEIKKFPKLMQIGSKREETQVGGFLNRKTDGIPHSGHYLQEDIKEVVEYAKERFITIIPEIDLPGHTRAILASYPNLSCRGYKFRVSPHWGIHRDVLCIGKEEVFEFVQGVLNEIIELFPSNIIHIGGDEVPTNRWKECPYCQSRINKEGLDNEEELQAYFTNRIAAFLNSKEIQVIGWNDILNENLKEKIICQYWIRRKDKLIEHLQKGGETIMSNFKYTYLDHSYSFTPLKLAYNFEPIPKILHNRYHNHILGLEALMWGEFIPNIRRLEWQTFPRLIAFSEVGWTLKDKRNFNVFRKRLALFLKRLDLLGINYANKKEANPGFLKGKEGISTLVQIQDEDNLP